ncbi:hypothetical protein Hanom_Chr11g00990641 [Helianthus anomalus]
MFSSNQNPWDPTNPFWQSLQNNEQEDRYRRDPCTGELGYYPMPPSTLTSSHRPLHRCSIFTGIILNLHFSSKHTPNPKHNPNRIRTRNPSRTHFIKKKAKSSKEG